MNAFIVYRKLQDRDLVRLISV